MQWHGYCPTKQLMAAGTQKTQQYDELTRPKVKSPAEIAPAPRNLLTIEYLVNTNTVLLVSSGTPLHIFHNLTKLKIYRSAPSNMLTYVYCIWSLIWSTNNFEQCILYEALEHYPLMLSGGEIFMLTWKVVSNSLTALVKKEDLSSFLHIPIYSCIQLHCKSLKITYILFYTNRVKMFQSVGSRSKILFPQISSLKELSEEALKTMPLNSVSTTHQHLSLPVCI